jgi:FlaG/FlaF family flagellin (archaellin)
MRKVHFILGTNPSRQRRLFAATASQSGKTIRERKSLLPAVSLVIALTFILAACGATVSGSGTGSTGSSPSPTATTVNTGSTTEGCPSNAVVTSKPAPNVTVNLKDMNSTVTAHVADIVEVDLPFGQMWSGPTSSQSILTQQQPSGFAWSAGKVCVWRFTTQNTGTEQLTFSGRPICKKGEACPQYIMQVPFTIVVK